jgi:hypothetical protein
MKDILLFLFFIKFIERFLNILSVEIILKYIYQLKSYLFLKKLKFKQKNVGRQSLK